MDTIELNAGTHLPVPQGGTTREPSPLQLPSAHQRLTPVLIKSETFSFGAVVRDTDKKLARLEERLLKEQEDLKEDAHRRFESLEVFVKKEMESLAERLQAGAQHTG